jgi:hypothetical protein
MSDSSSQGNQGGGGPTLFEIVRRLDDITQQVAVLNARVEQGYVRHDIFEATKQLSEAERGQLDVRLSKLESRSEWLIRTVGGIIIAGLLALVIAAPKIAGGG